MPPVNTGNPADNPHVLAFSLLKALGAAMAPNAAPAQQFVLAGKEFPKIYEKARRALGAVPDLDAASQEAVAALLDRAKVLQAGDPALSLEQALMGAYERLGLCRGSNFIKWNPIWNPRPKKEQGARCF